MWQVVWPHLVQSLGLVYGQFQNGGESLTLLLCPGGDLQTSLSNTCFWKNQAPISQGKELHVQISDFQLRAVPLIGLDTIAYRPV